MSSSRSDDGSTRSKLRSLVEKRLPSRDKSPQPQSPQANRGQNKHAVSENPGSHDQPTGFNKSAKPASAQAKHAAQAQDKIRKTAAQSQHVVRAQAAVQALRNVARPKQAIKPQGNRSPGVATGVMAVNFSSAHARQMAQAHSSAHFEAEYSARAFENYAHESHSAESWEVWGHQFETTHAAQGYHFEAAAAEGNVAAYQVAEEQHLFVAADSAHESAEAAFAGAESYAELNGAGVWKRAHGDNGEFHEHDHDEEGSQVHGDFAGTHHLEDSKDVHILLRHLQDDAHSFASHEDLKAHAVDEDDLHHHDSDAHAERDCEDFDSASAHEIHNHCDHDHHTDHHNEAEVHSDHVDSDDEHEAEHVDGVEDEISSDDGDESDDRDHDHDHDHDAHHIHETHDRDDGDHWTDSDSE